MMRYLLGEVEEVHAMQTNRVLTEIDCPDSNIVTLKFESGAVGSLTTYWAFDNGDWSHTNGIDILYKDQLINWNPSRLRIKENDEYIDKTETSLSIDEVFVKAVRSGDRSQILSPYSDAVKTMAISIAANQSGHTSKPIHTIAPNSKYIFSPYSEDTRTFYPFLMFKHTDDTRTGLFI